MATLGEFVGSGSGVTKLLLHLNGNATDYSGNGNDGTLTNINYSQANGRFGQGAGFNGSSSQISFATGFGITGNYTISMWINITALPTSGNLKSFIGSYSFGGTKGFEIRMYNNSGTQQVDFIHISSGNTVNNVTYVGDLPTGVWQLLTCTYNGSTMKIYLNAKEIATANVTNNPVNGDTTLLGNVTGYPTRFFNGAMDEVIIDFWTPQQLSKYYSNNRGFYATL